MEVSLHNRYLKVGNLTFMKLLSFTKYCVCFAISLLLGCGGAVLLDYRPSILDLDVRGCFGRRVQREARGSTRLSIPPLMRQKDCCTGSMESVETVQDLLETYMDVGTSRALDRTPNRTVCLLICTRLSYFS